MSFAEACGVADASRAAACEAVTRRMRDEGIDLVRVGWCDTHGMLRGKTLTASAVSRALASGIGLVLAVPVTTAIAVLCEPRGAPLRHREPATG